MNDETSMSQESEDVSDYTESEESEESEEEETEDDKHDTESHTETESKSEISVPEIKSTYSGMDPKSINEDDEEEEEDEDEEDDISIEVNLQSANSTSKPDKRFNESVKQHSSKSVDINTSRNSSGIAVDQSTSLERLPSNGSFVSRRGNIGDKSLMFLPNPSDLDSRSMSEIEELQTIEDTGSQMSHDNNRGVHEDHYSDDDEEVDAFVKNTTSKAPKQNNKIEFSAFNRSTGTIPEENEDMSDVSNNNSGYSNAPKRQPNENARIFSQSKSFLEPPSLTFKQKSSPIVVKSKPLLSNSRPDDSFEITELSDISDNRSIFSTVEEIKPERTMAREPDLPSAPTKSAFK